MSKIDKIIYGIEDEDLLNKITRALSYKEASWGNINPTAFDEVDIDALKLKGHCYKNFYRCFSNSIPNLSEEMFYKNNNSYITCFSNIAPEGLVPEKISCLLKNARTLSLVQEVLSTQVLHYFECNTPFNFAVKTENKKNKYLASVDFISENEKMILLKDLNLIWTTDLNAIIKQLECLAEDKNSILYNISKQNLTKLKEDLVKSFLARICVVRDSDFDNYNCGVLLNKKTNNISFINFDFELGLKYASLYDGTSTTINTIMLYAMQEYPEIYNDFIKKVYDMKKVITEINFETDNKNYNEILFNLKQNLKKAITIHNDLSLEFNNNPLTLQ